MQANGQTVGSAVITLVSTPAWVITLAGIYVLLFLSLVIAVLKIWPPSVAVPWIELRPQIVTVVPGFTQLFEARIWHARDQGVNWSATAGLISPNGLFTAPITGSMAVLTATSTADKNLTQSVLILLNKRGLLVSPPSATLVQAGPLRSRLRNMRQFLLPDWQPGTRAVHPPR